jgi:predicted secreted protein with PEFG-CTERM motif
MLKFALLALVALSIPISAFAEPMIELSTAQTNIKSFDSVLVFGKISDVAIFKPVKLTVIAPDGEIVYAPELPIGRDGEFKRLIHPTLPSFKEGTYTVIASHEDAGKTAQIKFTVVGELKSPTGTPSGLPKPEIGKDGESPINLSAETVFGDNKITVVGNTATTQTDITFTVNAPGGNLVSIAQITPKANGEFSLEMTTGGPLWQEDGMYTITANQGIFSEHKNSIQVEISNGVVVPEFGTIAVMILTVAIISIIAISAKSKVGIFPRY